MIWRPILSGAKINNDKKRTRSDFGEGYKGIRRCCAGKPVRVGAAGPKNECRNNHAIYLMPSWDGWRTLVRGLFGKFSKKVLFQVAKRNNSYQKN